jgi:hypothetical protein
MLRNDFPNSKTLTIPIKILPRVQAYLSQSRIHSRGFYVTRKKYQIIIHVKFCFYSLRNSQTQSEYSSRSFHFISLQILWHFTKWI